MKKKLLVVILFCLGIVGIAHLVLAGAYPVDFNGSGYRPEVINVDLNADGDANVYAGKAAYDTGIMIYSDSSIWHVFYRNMTVGATTIPGWGIPVGSARSCDLSDSNDPNNPATYAAQVWIGSKAANTIGYRDANYSSPGLMNDGLMKTSGNDPCIVLFGQHAYTGNFDIYVYGSRAGNFGMNVYDPCIFVIANPPYTVIHPNTPASYNIYNQSAWVNTTKSVTGGFDVNTIVGKNFQVFTDVNIGVNYSPTFYSADTNDGNALTITDSNGQAVYLSYSNVINGLQLVSRKQPFVVQNTGTRIPAGSYFVAGERSGQCGRQTNNAFGPNLGSIGDGNFASSNVFLVDRREFMVYDINIDKANEGRYSIVLETNPSSYGDTVTSIFVDDVNMGTVIRSGTPSPRPPGPPDTGTVDVNLTPGIHTIEWMHSGTPGSSTGFAVLDINIIPSTPDASLSIPNCAGVANYGLIYKGDLNNDCVVDKKDLELFSNDWLSCDDPNWRNCK